MFFFAGKQWADVRSRKWKALSKFDKSFQSAVIKIKLIPRWSGPGQNRSKVIRRKPETDDMDAQGLQMNKSGVAQIVEEFW